MDRRIGLGFGVVLSAMLGGVALADGPTTQIPLSDFLATQGTTSNFIAPFGDFWGWTAPPPGVKTPLSNYVGGTAGSCDYLGVVNKTLVDVYGMPDIGTTVSGSVTERTLSDGRILVKVDTVTRNAYAFANKIETPPFGDNANDTLVFGARWDDLVLGATPAIGECHAAFAWKQDPGPLHDFSIAFEYADLEIVDLSFRANATGPLTAAAGLGPDGTPGKMIISQTGIFHTSFKGATADAFPAEYVELRKVGK